MKSLTSMPKACLFFAFTLFTTFLSAQPNSVCNNTPAKRDLPCGVVKSGNTNTDGSNQFDKYICFNNSLTGYNAKEVVYYITSRPNYVHDILVEFEDLDRRGLDIFVVKNCGPSNQGDCEYYALRTGSDPKYFSFTLKNTHPNDYYYIIIDAQSSTGRYNIKATCTNQGYLCNNAIPINCGASASGNTNNGTDNYYDYSCFHYSLTNFHGKEVVYYINNRPNYYHDLEIEIEDLDRVGLDLFIVENCGQNNYKCYAYKERSGSDPQKESITLKNTDPNKEYYVIIDTKSSYGKYKLNIYCNNKNYACDNYRDLKCGVSYSYDTKNGSAKIDDYSCFHPDLTGFYAKEVVYKLINHPSSDYDLEIEFEDLDARGLDLYVVENCGQDDYKCYAYKTRSSSDPKKFTYTVYNLDYHKQYYIIVDAKSVTGRYKILANCKPKGYHCEKAIAIDCGETKYGHTKDGYADYDNYSCYASHLTGFYEKELIYKISNRPSYTHDINIYLEDIYDKGLDIFVIEDCGKTNYSCYAYKERTTASPKKDYLKLSNTDPNKDYYVIIDAKNVTSSFYLTVECEDKTQCENLCYSYIYRGDGHYDFYWPEYYSQDFYEWKFEKLFSNQSEKKSAGDIYGYQFPFGNGLYRVYLLDKDGKALCFYDIRVDECENDLPEIKSFSYELDNCSGNSCDITLKSEIASNTIYYNHIYLNYYDQSHNRYFFTNHPDTTFAIFYPDDLKSVCLVVSNTCGMTSYCIQGNCYQNSSPTYTIQPKSDEQVELTFGTWQVSCNYDSRKVYIDWGDGKSSEHSYSSNLKPNHTYSKPGYYTICVRYYYDCSGNSYPNPCVICVCKTVRLGACEDTYEYQCEKVQYLEEEYLDGAWQYRFTRTDPPDGYTFQNYEITDIGSGEKFQTMESASLPAGKQYQLCAVYKNGQGCYYYCCREFEVFFPSTLNIHIPDRSGGNGTMVEIPVLVDGFSEITGFQFRIQIQDVSIAQVLDTVLQLNPDLPLNTNDVTISTTQNLINVAWTTSQADQALTLEDGSTLFVFKVMILGQTGDETVADISNALAFNNLTSQQIDVSTDPGSIRVETAFSISGFITKEDGSAMANTTVHLTGTAMQTTQTDNNGAYRFTGLTGGDYEVYPAKSQSFHDGVNVLDLAVIKSYNRTLEPGMLNPYQLQAANVRIQLDGGQLTVADETEINRMVSFDIDDFGDYSTSWKFIPQSYSFANPEQAYLESPPSRIALEDLSDDRSDQNFLGVKIGDINGSVSVEPRTQSAVQLAFIQQNQAETGDSIWVSVRAKDFVNIQNLQFSLEWDPEVLTFTGWYSDFADLQLSETSFSRRYIDDGKLTFVHSLAPGTISFEDTTLFVLQFAVIGTDGSSTSLGLSDDPVEILVTDDQFVVQEVNVTQSTITVGMPTSVNQPQVQQTKVGQNHPNPFSTQTLIPLEFSAAMNVRIQILDPTGRMIRTEDRYFSAGRHLYRVQGADLHGNGVYIYRIVTAEGAVSRTMIYLE